MNTFCMSYCETEPFKASVKEPRSATPPKPPLQSRSVNNVFAVRAARKPIPINKDKIKPYRTALISGASGNKSTLTTGTNHIGNRMVKIAKRQFLSHHITNFSPQSFYVFHNLKFMQTLSLQTLYLQSWACTHQRNLDIIKVKHRFGNSMDTPSASTTQKVFELVTFAIICLSTTLKFCQTQPAKSFQPQSLAVQFTSEGYLWQS